MTSAERIPQPRETDQRYSLEITTGNVQELNAVTGLLPGQTQVSITSLDGETTCERVGVAESVWLSGFAPVPHLAARRIESESELEFLLAQLQDRAHVEQVLVLAGDIAKPNGPYEDGLALIKSGLLAKYGIRKVFIPGYPTGHPKIADAELWAVLHEKVHVLRQMALDIEIVTQFSFDASAVLGWIARLRESVITEPVRVGIPGPTSAKSLLAFARHCGVGASAKMIAKYGISVGNLLRTSGPDRFLQHLADGYDPNRHGRINFHLYSFGGLEKTARWAVESGFENIPKIDF